MISKPGNWVIYREFCLKMCPNGTYDADIAVNSTFSRKYCLPCTPTSCPKSCQIKNDDAIDKTNIHLLKDCQELKGNLKIIHSIDLRLLLLFGDQKLNRIKINNCFFL